MLISSKIPEDTWFVSKSAQIDAFGYEACSSGKYSCQIVSSITMKSSVCIATLIEHMITASSDVMKGTKHEGSWLFFYHNAFSLMTCQSTVN
ncbi:hypothetical protein PsorP6_016836 [Peronosclerospora sorghi]|uniref:Uncharacterized protein n=1 Tax=Peronosclerospora sorghi TaxID=230839 RepID=A0ACC0WDW7_9STRA|nr:hypothetical protein PsorP6_016836 [Peronosclerospora sorghi]